MASLEQIGEALRRADAAGNVDDARALAQAYRAMQQQTPAPAAAAPAQDPLTVPTQGMSGVNEGVANFLSLPNSIELGLRSIGPGIANMFGGNFQMPTESLLPDAGANYRNLSTEIGAIKPPTDDAPSRFARRVGQELGANLLPVAATPAKVAGAMSTLGSGLGAATMQQAFPGNQIAEMAGQFMGGGVPLGIGNQVERVRMQPATPTIDDLRATRNAAYKAAENTGAVYSPEAYDNMLAGLAQDVTEKHISPTRHAAASSFIQDMNSRRGKPMTLTELDQLRQEVRRDLITPSYTNQEKAADAYFGDLILDRIDEMIETNSGASGAMQAARQAHSTLRKSELIEEALTKAARRTASTGSGGNINNAIRQNIRAILDNPKKSKAFTVTEKAQMESLIKQGKTEELLRLVGKLSPSGNGLMAALGIGGTAMNPLLAAAPLAGMGAKSIADRMTLAKAKALQNTVAKGAPFKAPIVAPRSKQVLAALLSGQAANQNTPRQSALAAALKASGQ